MTSQFKEKAVRLGKLMNGKSKFAIPLVQCILDCFEIVYTEEEIDCMLLMGAGNYTKEELIALWEKNYGVTGDENVHTFEALYKSIKDKGGIWESQKKAYMTLHPYFPAG